MISRGFTGKTLRAVRNEWTQYIEEHPEELTKFPEQMGTARRRPTRCTSAATRHADVDPDKECYPSGQGVGAIARARPRGRPRAPASSTKPSTRSRAPPRPSCG